MKMTLFLFTFNFTAMKKYIFFTLFLILIAFFANAQSQWSPIIKVANDSTAFTLAVPANSLVFDVSQNKMYKVSLAGSTLKASTKTLIFGSEGETGATGATGPTGATGATGLIGTIDTTHCYSKIMNDTTESCNNYVINSKDNFSVLLENQSILRITNVDSANILIGLGAGMGNTEKIDQIAVGNYAGYQSTGNSTYAIGNGAGNANTGEYVNLFGYNAGSGNSGNEVIGIGNNSAMGNTGNNIIALGKYSAVGTGSNSIFIGYNSGYTNAGNKIIAIGDHSAEQNTADSIIAIGDNSGFQNTGKQIIGFGDYSNYGNSGNNVIAIGTSAGSFNSGNNVFAIGNGAGSNNTLSNVMFFGPGDSTSAPAYYNMLTKKWIFNNDVKTMSINIDSTLILSQKVVGTSDSVLIRENNQIKYKILRPTKQIIKCGNSQYESFFQITNSQLGQSFYDLLQYINFVPQIDSATSTFQNGKLILKEAGNYLITITIQNLDIFTENYSALYDSIINFSLNWNISGGAYNLDNHIQKKSVIDSLFILNEQNQFTFNKIYGHRVSNITLKSFITISGYTSLDMFLIATFLTYDDQIIQNFNWLNFYNTIIEIEHLR